MRWRCPQCGKSHEKNDPPCGNCGHHKLEQAITAAPVDDGEDYEQFAWACTECGRVHQRNSPPCKRCGNVSFEKQSMAYEDFEAESTTRYRELIGEFEAGVIVVVVVAIAVLGLGFLGVIDVPGLGPTEPPTIDNVPGSPDSYQSVALSDVEEAVVDSVNERRNGSSLSRSEGLDDAATYSNQVRVKNRYEETDRSVTGEELQAFDLPCEGTPSLSSGTVTVGENATASSLSDALALQAVGESRSITNESVQAVGVDAHVGPDGELFVTALYC